MKNHLYLLLWWCIASSVLLSSVGGDDAAAPMDKASSCQGRLALITGATGRVGSLVTERLAQQQFCLVLLTRNATKAEEKLGHLRHDGLTMEFVVGQLGDGMSVSRAFQAAAAFGGVSHVIFAAGGEEADYDAVNHRGVAECAQEAQKAGTNTMIVISSAWVSKPYSLASLLFNSIYPTIPMGLHFAGEEALRQFRQQQNYVILRPARIRPDEEFPPEAPTGLLYGQGDSFFFFGPAGDPGMCNTQVANAVMTALSVEGQYTVEVTGGTVDPHDASVYLQLEQDTNTITRAWSKDEIVTCHANALKHLKLAVILFMIAGVQLGVGLRSVGVLPKMILILATLVAFIVGWIVFLSNKSVLDCFTTTEKSQQGSVEL